MSDATAAAARMGDVQAVVMGASAGAVSALSQLLPALPKGYRLPILIVVHVPANPNTNLAGLFQPKCHVTVKEAEDKEPIVPGTVYFAPPDYHLLIERGRYVSLSVEEPVNFSRPSIDVLFESAADVYGRRLLGIILTGANHDGAQGLHLVSMGGGLAVVQTPASAEAAAMPEAALKACEQAQPMSLAAMSALLAQAR